MQLWSVCVSASPHYRKCGLYIGSDLGWWSLMNKGRTRVAQEKQVSEWDSEAQNSKETLSPFLPVSICWFGFSFFFFLLEHTVCHRTRIHLIKAEEPLERGLLFQVWLDAYHSHVLASRLRLIWGLPVFLELRIWFWVTDTQVPSMQKRDVMIQVWYS